MARGNTPTSAPDISNRGLQPVAGTMAPKTNGYTRQARANGILARMVSPRELGIIRDALEACGEIWTCENCPDAEDCVKFYDKLSDRAEAYELETIAYHKLLATGPPS